MLTRRTVITASREAVYGSDPAMTGANGILAWDVDLDISGEMLKRDILRDNLSPAPHVLGMKEVKLSFKTEFKGAGVDGTNPLTPETDPLLQGCGFSTSATEEGTVRTFRLGSAESSMYSVAFRVYKDGNMHKVTGARGTFSLTLEAGQFAVANWEFSGIYNAVVADTVMDISSLPVTLPKVVYNSSFQIGGFSPVCSTAEIDLANTVTKRADLNSSYGVHSFRISSREPKMNFTADAVVEASNPFWGDWAGEVVDSYSINIKGVSAETGNNIEVSGYIEYETNKYGDEDGISTFETTASLVSSNVNVGDDELVIKFL